MVLPVQGDEALRPEGRKIYQVIDAAKTNTKVQWTALIIGKEQIMAASYPVSKAAPAQHAPEPAARPALETAAEGDPLSEKLRHVIDAIPTLAWCNLPDGTNEFLNKNWHEYTGLSPDQSHGSGWQAAFHPEDLPPLLEKWRGMLVSGEPGEIEARLRRHDGVYRWFLIRAEPFREEGGQIIRWYGTSTDIDDRKRAEERLRRSEAFLA